MVEARRSLGKVKLFSARQKPRPRTDCSPCQIAALRLRDLAKLFRARYGVVLPDDDSGRDDIDVAVHHLASLAHPRGRITKWLELWAPWFTLAERTDLVTKAIARQQHWTADQLAWRLRLTKEDRRMLGITTIGAIDLAKRERTKLRRSKAKHRAAGYRRARGAKPRAQYEAAAINRAQPWIAEGISRRTWYRRHRGTGPNTP